LDCNWDQPRADFGTLSHEPTSGADDRSIFAWEKPWLAFAVLVMLLRQARHLHLLHSIGPLYLMFTRLFADVLKFTIIVSVVIIAFSGSLYRLFEGAIGCEAFYHENAFTRRSSSSSPTPRATSAASSRRTAGRPSWQSASRLTCAQAGIPEPRLRPTHMHRPTLSGVREPRDRCMIDGMH
jgi:hypothetical protein